MDIRIGIQNSPRELSFESNQSAAEIESLVSQAIDNGAKILKLKDNKGRLFLVPVASIGYVECGAEESRRVGFIA
ncbi:MAG: hypothetical protein RL488_694 [Actinomycetota bacterium]